MRIPPEWASLAMSLSSVSIVVWSLLLKLYSPPDILGETVAAPTGAHTVVDLRDVSDLTIKSRLHVPLDKLSRAAETKDRSPSYVSFREGTFTVGGLGVRACIRALTHCLLVCLCACIHDTRVSPVSDLTTESRLLSEASSTV